MRSPTRPPFLRRLAEITVLGLCAYLILRSWVVEPFAVPTGSMAPTLHGAHRAADCPRCGFPVVVGKHPRDAGDSSHWYRGVCCPNCGYRDLALADAGEAPGDQLLVNRNAYWFRRPR